MNWEIVENKIRQVMQSNDKRWSISKTQDGNEEGKYFLSNYDLILAPHGSGSNQKACFESFVRECDAYIEKVRKIQEEAKEYLKQLEASND